MQESKRVVRALKVPGRDPAIEPRNRQAPPGIRRRIARNGDRQAIRRRSEIDRSGGLGKPRRGPCDDGDRGATCVATPATGRHAGTRSLVTDAAPGRGSHPTFVGSRLGSGTMRRRVTTAERFHATGEQPVEQNPSAMPPCARRPVCPRQKRGGRLSFRIGFWYNPTMNPLETASAPVAYTGRVKNGVVVLDAQISLSEGQEVRVEPVQPKSPAVSEARTAQVEAMKRMFAEWDEEDSKLSDEEADRLHVALQQSPRLTFRTPKLD